MTIRAVCTDIDGTLLDGNRELSTRTISVFRKISRLVPVILASSRMPSAMTHLQKQLGISEYPLICYNGGYVPCYAEDGSTHIYDSVTISLEVCKSIIEIGKRRQVHISLYNNDVWFAPQHDHWAEREARITKVNPIIEDNQAVLEKWKRDGAAAHKIMCMGPAEQISIMHEELNEKHGGDIHVYLSRPTYLELAPKSISKGSALKMILEEHFRIPVSDALAFGDNYNDIDMLEVAGLGIAVNNAREEVKAIADRITLNSIDDGVAAAIASCFNLQE
jgi:Cof subfamily protein (haloacid dehalogenase superfamily)